MKTAGLIGDRFIELSPGGSGFLLEPGDLIVDTESALDVESMIRRFAIGGIAQRANNSNDSLCLISCIECVL